MERLYVVTHTHKQFVHWCGEQGLSPRDPGLVEVGPWNHERLIRGTWGVRFVLLDYFDGAPLVLDAVEELEYRQGVAATRSEVEAFVSSRRSARAASAS